MSRPTQQFGDLVLMLVVGVALLRPLGAVGVPAAGAGALSVVVALAFHPGSPTARALRALQGALRTYLRSPQRRTSSA